MISAATSTARTSLRSGWHQWHWQIHGPHGWRPGPTGRHLVGAVEGRNFSFGVQFGSKSWEEWQKGGKKNSGTDKKSQTRLFVQQFSQLFFSVRLTAMESEAMEEEGEQTEAQKMESTMDVLQCPLWVCFEDDAGVENRELTTGRGSLTYETHWRAVKWTNLESKV